MLACVAQKNGKAHPAIVPYLSMQHDWEVPISVTTGTLPVPMHAARGRVGKWFVHLLGAPTIGGYWLWCGGSSASPASLFMDSGPSSSGNLQEGDKVRHVAHFLTARS